MKRRFNKKIFKFNNTNLFESLYLGGLVSGWVGEWVGGWESGWVGEWVGGWVSGWVGEWVGG